MEGKIRFKWIKMMCNDHPNRRRRKGDRRCRDRIIIGFIITLDVNINNDDLLLEFFSKTFTRKDHNNTGGGLLIYFKDHISVERVTGLPRNETIL
jgi:hypothetical protein